MNNIKAIESRMDIFVEKSKAAIIDTQAESLTSKTHAVVLQLFSNFGLCQTSEKKDLLEEVQQITYDIRRNPIDSYKKSLFAKALQSVRDSLKEDGDAIQVLDKALETLTHQDYIAAFRDRAFSLFTKSENPRQDKKFIIIELGDLEIDIDLLLEEETRNRETKSTPYKLKEYAACKDLRELISAKISELLRI